MSRDTQFWSRSDRATVSGWRVDCVEFNVFMARKGSFGISMMASHEQVVRGQLEIEIVVMASSHKASNVVYAKGRE